MRKPLVMILAVIFVLSFISVAISGAPSGKITIKLTGAKDATFDHTAHEKHAANCQTCHHKDAAGSEQKCTTCHTATGKDGALAGKDAFHKQCKDCHTKMGKGPKTCTGCHK